VARGFRAVAQRVRCWLVQGLRSGNPARSLDVFRFFAQVRMRVADGATGAVVWFWKGRTQPLSFSEAAAGQTSGSTLRRAEARRDGVDFSR